MHADAQLYTAKHGDGSYSPGQYTESNAPSFNEDPTCQPSGWFVEEALDVEAVHAMAPGAKIRYYGAASCFDSDIFDTQSRVVDQNKVSIVTNSYGEPEELVSADTAAAEQALFLQAGLQGISFMFSSGDSGDELANTGINQADTSATDPYVTAVGGTSTAIDINGSLSWQSGWGVNKHLLSANGKSWLPGAFLAGSGGGYSAVFERPAYQQGVVPAYPTSGRAVPDIAMDGDNSTGMLVGITQTYPDGSAHYGEYRLGGTSLSSPLFAGMVALRSQYTGKRLGFLNPTLYSKSRSGLFYDVKGSPPDAGVVRVDYANTFDASAGYVYSVRTFNQDSSLAVAPGWDDVTGIGVPKPSWLTR
jgi:subtilase family serine protease